MDLRDQYASASPFPHIVIDRFLSAEEANSAADCFPDASGFSWHKFLNAREKKLASRPGDTMPDGIQNVLDRLCESTFTSWLSWLTGIDELESDRRFVGGGMHCIERGGKLDIHADFNVHPYDSRIRRVNLLLYLNRDWNEEYGGHLELWSKDMSKCEARILPIFNRAVIFTATDDSWHGHPTPLSCPEGRTRNSIAAYYYTKPDSSIVRHGTIFKR